MIIIERGLTHWETPVFVVLLLLVWGLRGADGGGFRQGGRPYPTAGVRQGGSGGLFLFVLTPQHLVLCMVVALLVFCLVPSLKHSSICSQSISLLWTSIVCRDRLESWNLFDVGIPLQLFVVVDTIATVLDVVAIVTRFFAEKSLCLSTSNMKIHFTTISVALHTGSRIGSGCSPIFFTYITHLIKSLWWNIF